jgi:simple sugar transport system ATP-binding protein
MFIEIKHISKTFGKIHANQDITFTLHSGRIVGILGENGAGKSTLMKILAGYQPADSGEIWLDGKKADYHTPEMALAAGIGMLQQDVLDIGAFSVLENFIYGQHHASMNLALQAAHYRDKLLSLCQELGFALDPQMPISQLTIAQRQQLEIVRLLSTGIRALILDEPTTGISTDQKEALFDTLRKLAQQDMTILLVSHKLEDVLALCSEVAVLRAGRLIETKALPVPKRDLIKLMFGQTMVVPQLANKDLSKAPLIIELKDVTLHEGRLHIPNIQFRARAGEIIGLAGLDGSGQNLLLRACAGLVKTREGQIWLSGQHMTGQGYPNFFRRGVIFGAAGRLEEGLIAGLTLAEHLTLVMADNKPKRGIFANFLIDRAQVQRITEEKINHYNIRGTVNSRIESLSGGNQQRVLMAMLPDNPAALLLEQPTRGLDVDSAAWIWEQLLAKCNAGATLVFSSPDLDELLLYSDRIIVFYAGQLTVIDHPHQITADRLGHLIGGVDEE